MFSHKKEGRELVGETDKEDRMKEEQDKKSDEGEEMKTGNQAQGISGKAKKKSHIGAEYPVTICSLHPTNAEEATKRFLLHSILWNKVLLGKGLCNNNKKKDIKSSSFPFFLTTNYFFLDPN